MRSKFFSSIALLAFAGAHAEDVDLEKVVDSLIAGEKAYAKLAGEKGFREASISVFADDAVIFAPHAVNGKKFWREAEKETVISWRPIFASIPRSGELGYTTGALAITQIARPRKTGRVRTFRYNLAKEQRQRVESCPRCRVGSSTATRSGDRN
jgi:hypothetical protein